MISFVLGIVYVIIWIKFYVDYKRAIIKWTLVFPVLVLFSFPSFRPNNNTDRKNNEESKEELLEMLFYLVSVFAFFAGFILAFSKAESPIFLVLYWIIAGLIINLIDDYIKKKKGNK